MKRGADVAGRVFEWSKLDGGHEAFLRTFPPVTPPGGPGLWEPTPPGFLPALQPYWGANRPFALRSGSSCWSTKYRYNLLRPVTYVGRLIDPAGRHC